MPGKGGRLLQMRSCNTERYAFGGEEFMICEREERVGEGGRCGWGEILYGISCSFALRAIGG